MDGETKRRLLALVEAGDVYGLMLASVGLWADGYHQDLGPLVLVAERGPGKSSGVFPIPRPLRPPTLPPS
jgi:hypothetical protein